VVYRLGDPRNQGNQPSSCVRLLHRRISKLATVDPSTTPESRPTSRWWHETRFNARGFKVRRIGSDPSSSVRVETGTNGGAGNLSRHHTPSNSVTSIESPHAMAGEGLNELSTKLVEAVEKQADLEDTLAVTRHALEVANQKVKQLELAQKEYADMMDRGMLIEKKDVESETTELTRRLLEESKNRVQAENDKNKIEQELEMLTAKLFEEANNLVASARRESKALEKRNEQLHNRLEDTETLLQSQQDQLAELKAVMQRMQESDQQASPATPNLGGKPSRESLSRLLELSPLHITNVNSSDPDPVIDSAKSTDISPFSFLVRPQYRYDTPAYSDFKSFIRISRTNSHPRQYSGSFPSTTVMPSSAFFMPIGPHIAGSYPSKDSPPPPNRSPNPGNMSSPASYERLPLKEWRFVKRALTEDIEPTVRLDIAPGLSWIARRSVQSAILEGTLIIEPTPTNSIMVTYSCTLCGEKREGKGYGRTHRFCTGDNPSNQRYPLCQYCLERMRVTCDFAGFLRAVRDGIWKIEGEEGEERAWDESVRLRERMFWARLGTQGWNSTSQNGKPQQEEDRVSTETGGSGIDPTDRTVAGEPVTPELQITKTFEQMALHNAEIQKAETLRNEPKEEDATGKESGEFVDALESGLDEADSKDEDKTEESKTEDLQAQH
jgi:Rab guanine nucleotide exchange factor SEC2